ncbi:MAG: c-type cytochrome [Flavobacteriales bacterium]|nr:c-type cytochrome [Flavobacteriales bacterium]
MRRFLIIGACVAAACHFPQKEATVAHTTPYHFDLPQWAVADTTLRMAIPYDNPTTVEGVALGRALFHDRALSANGTLSCASCHKQAHAFADPRAVSSGADGSTGRRNAQPLINLAWDHFFFWDARALSLELQAFEPVRGHREMGSDWGAVTDRLRHDPSYPGLFRAAFGDERIDSMRIAFALAQFERTLISLRSRYDRFAYEGDRTALNERELRGKDLFFTSAHCVDCHEPPLFDHHDVSNIGLDSLSADGGLGERTGMPWHWGRFKTPTLRNIALTAPYMHDGRFSTLEEVIDFYADDVRTGSPTLDPHMQPWVNGEVKLSEQDRADLAAFLRTLTDSAFVIDPRHGPAER